MIRSGRRLERNGLFRSDRRGMTTPELAENEFPAQPPPKRRRSRTLPPTVSFWFTGALLGLFLMASTAPSPMYSIYQQRWGFTSTVLTEVFAVYNVAILVSLLLFGAVSDRLGRRPVLLAALVVEILSVLALAMASGVGWLYLGRVLQGLATGAATSAISGALLDFQPPGSNRGATINGIAASSGLALGSALAGTLVQFAPGPTVLTFMVLLIGFVLAVPAVLAMPEPITRERGNLRRALRPQVPALPRGQRTRFLLLGTTLLASWTVGGMFMSLGPSVAKTLVAGHPYFLGGLTVAVLTGFGALAQLTFSGWSGPRAVRVGALLMIIGLIGVNAAVHAEAAVAFFGISVVLGIGWGLMFMGGFRMMSRLATPETRAGTSAMIYVVAYVSAGITSVALGMLTTAFGLINTTGVFAVAASVFAAAAALTTFRR